MWFSAVRSSLSRHWGTVALVVILLSVIAANIRPGYFILGNDNYSPEVAPLVTLSRSVFSPAWRTYRVLGVPSDSEQADIVRSAVFAVMETVLPAWLVSQLAVFFAFFMGSFATARLADELVGRKFVPGVRPVVPLVAGILFMGNLLTSWMLFSPLKVFLAGYAFLPFVLWRMAVWYRKPGMGTLLWLMAAMACLTTSAMVPTTFIVESGVVLAFLVQLMWIHRRQYVPDMHVRLATTAVAVVFLTQLFWILPFVRYVGTNSPALKASYINRVLTPGLLEEEATYNALENVPRYMFAWIDTKNDNGSFQFPYRLFYKENRLGGTLSFLTPVLSVAGVVILVAIMPELFMVPVLAILGLLLIKGTHAPLGDAYVFLQQHIPLFEQVFRWQSSKLFPLLTITQPVLGSLAVTWVAAMLMRRGNRIAGGIAASLFVTGIIAATCVYVYPYFVGGLVGNRSYVSVPGSYGRLASYLNRTDPTGRIYVMPESNTLYFRSYRWGFFGSSFLNYLIPNPLIERALTTGSMESEAAQRMIEAYSYAKDPGRFVRALHQFNVRYVLVDRDAVKLDNGYDYDWGTLTRVIDGNDALSVVFSDGPLTLYKVADDTASEDGYATLGSGHDPAKLAALAPGISLDPQVSGPGITGALYPMALPADSVTIGDSAVIVSSAYRGTKAAYSLDADPDSMASAPASFSAGDNGTIRLSPAYPKIRVGTRTLTVPAPHRDIAVPDGTRYLTVGDSIIDLVTARASSFVSDATYRAASASVTAWKPMPDTAFPYLSGGEKYALTFPEDTILTVDVTLSSAVAVVANTCIWSTKTYLCLNRDHAALITSVPRTFTVPLLKPVRAGDTIEVYVRGVDGKAPVESGITVSGVVARSARAVKPLTPGDERPAMPTAESRITLSPGDAVATVIPVITGPTTYRLGMQAGMVPPITASSCGNTADYGVRPTDRGSLSMTGSMCSLYAGVTVPRIEPPVSGALAFIAYAGENRSGMTMTVDLKQAKTPRKLFEDRLPMSGSGAFVSYVPLADETITYDLELFSYAAGRVSDNRLDRLVFQFLPPAWLSERLLPDSSSVPPDTRVLTTDQAVHPGWEITPRTRTSAATVNGWEQAWLVPSGETQFAVAFSPNRLADIGYASVIVTLAGVLGFWLQRTARRRSRNAR